MRLTILSENAKLDVPGDRSIALTEHLAAMKQSICARSEFLFLRHGQTDWNSCGLLQGRSDRPLNADGIVQARACAVALAREAIDTIVSSPLQRATQTATVVAEALGLPVIIEEQLIERGFGSLEGRPVREIAGDTGIGLDVASSTTLPQDAEPWRHVRERVMQAIDTWLSNSPNEKVLFVGHYGVMSAVCEALGVVSTPAKNAKPYRFSRNGSVWTMTEVINQSGT